MTKDEDLHEQEFSTGAIAKVFGFTSGRNIIKLHEKGYIPRARHGKYRLGEAVRGYVRFLKDIQKSSRHDARSGMMAWQERKLKMQVERQLGKLVPLELLSEVDRVLHTTLVAQIKALPDRLANELANREPAFIRERLQEEVRRICDGVAKGLAFRARVLRGDGEPQEDLGAAAETHALGMGGGEQGISARERGAGAVPGEEDAVLRAAPKRVRGSKVSQSRRGNGHADGEDGVVPQRAGKKAGRRPRARAVRRAN
jgi:hypothetical protein